MCGSQICSVAPEVDFESPRSLAKSESSTPNDIVVLYFPHDTTVCIHHFVIARASLLTDQSMSGLTNARQIKTFEDNLKAYVRKFSHGFQFFFFELMVVKTRSGYLYNCCVVLFANSRKRSTHFLA